MYRPRTVSSDTAATLAFLARAPCLCATTATGNTNGASCGTQNGRRCGNEIKPIGRNLMNPKFRKWRIMLSGR